jgi:acylphosphatase
MVQGVAFRYYAQRWASERRLTGWVRNLYDGRVEVVAEGDKKNLAGFLEQLEEGPRHARVEHLQIDWEEYRGEFLDFSIARSIY